MVSLEFDDKIRLLRWAVGLARKMFMSELAFGFGVLFFEPLVVDNLNFDNLVSILTERKKRNRIIRPVVHQEWSRERVVERSFSFAPIIGSLTWSVKLSRNLKLPIIDLMNVLTHFVLFEMKIFQFTGKAEKNARFIVVRFHVYILPANLFSSMVLRLFASFACCCVSKFLFCDTFLCNWFFYRGQIEFSTIPHRCRPYLSTPTVAAGKRTPAKRISYGN